MPKIEEITLADIEVLYISSFVFKENHVFNKEGNTFTKICYS